MRVLDPSRGVGTYVCEDYGMYDKCCGDLHMLNVKCTIISDVVDCVHNGMEDFIINISVVGDNVVVGCLPELDLSLFGQVVMMFCATMVAACVMEALESKRY